MKSHFQPLLTGLESSRALLNMAFKLVTNPLKFLFGSLVLRNVVRDSGDAGDGTGTVMDWKRPVADPPHRTVRSHDAIFFIIGSRCLFGQRSLPNPFPVLRMDGFEPRARRAI
jgi:hypothetical protein